MSEKSEYAVQLFQQGFNCAQSVLVVFCETYGMEQSLAFKTACGFGGGMRTGEICGAVSGAVMVIGLKYGHSLAEDAESKTTCYAKTVEFRNEFMEKNDSIVCKQILGYDISTEDGMEQAKEKGLFQTTCVQMIIDAVELLEKLGY